MRVATTEIFRDLSFLLAVGVVSHFVIRKFRQPTIIGEIGIGLNPMARIADDITEAKKALGTVHIALGDSANEYGGLVECDVHLDGLVMAPTIEFDGLAVVVDGRHVDAPAS